MSHSTRSTLGSGAGSSEFAAPPPSSTHSTWSAGSGDSLTCLPFCRERSRATRRPRREKAVVGGAAVAPSGRHRADDLRPRARTRLTGELADTEPDDLPRLRELLYGLYAILDSHFRKEERFYLPIVAGQELAEEIHAKMLAIEEGHPPTLERGNRRGPHGFPLDGEDDEKLAWAVPHAIQAPSSHNSQPWLFRVEDGTLELLADRTRALPVVDPHDRELTISCGAALFNVRAALRMAGELPAVEPLPEGDHTDLLARVSLSAGRAEPQLIEKQLFWSIRKRRTNRSRYADEPVGDEVLAVLGGAAADEGATLVVVREHERRGELAKLIAEGDRLQAGDPSFRRELASWLHHRRAHAQDGMPGSPHFVRTFDWGRKRAAKDEQLALGSPVLAVLTTPGDEPADWLAAGQALGHVLLRATVEDVVASFLNQPVEVGALRRRLRISSARACRNSCCASGARASAAHPRRPVADVFA